MFYTICFFFKILFSLYFCNDTFLSFISWFYGLSFLGNCLFTFADLSWYSLCFSYLDIFLSILSHLITQLQLFLCANVPCKIFLFSWLSFTQPKCQMSSVTFTFECLILNRNLTDFFSSLILYERFQWNPPYQPEGTADFFLRLLYKKKSKTRAWEVWQSLRSAVTVSNSHTPFGEFCGLVWFFLKSFF